MTDAAQPESKPAEPAKIPPEPAVVGAGVPRRTDILPGSKPEVRKVELSKPAPWGERPQVPNQHEDPNSSRVKHVECVLLDLSNPEHLSRLSEIRTNQHSQFNNCFITSEERRFDEKLSRFLVYLELTHMEFRQIIPEQKPKSV